MNGGTSSGFNPFIGSGIHKNYDDDIDLLEFDDDDEETEKKDDNVKKEVVIEKPTYETSDDVMRGIKEMIQSANENGVEVLKEEFAFDDMYQFVIRIPKKSSVNNANK
jgi:hypothetical protein